MKIEALTNIGSSTGYGKMWLYRTEDDTKATVKTVGYFGEGHDYGIENKEFIMIHCSDANFIGILYVTAGVVTLGAIDAF